MTINTAANQYRVLKQQLQNVGRTIGNLLIPIVEKALPVINGMVIALNRMLTTLGFSLFGKNWLSDLMSEVSSGNIEGLDDLEDDLDDVADAEDEATKKAKEFKKQLQGIDELNVLSKPDDDDDDSSKKDDDKKGTIDLSGAIADELANYDKIWEDALKGHKNLAEQWAKAITDAFSNSFTLGTLISSAIINGFNIDWENDVYPKFKTWGKNLASFMLGVLEPDEEGNTIFSAFGSAVAGGINSAVKLFEGWESEFKEGGGWEKLGKGIGDYVKSVVDGIEWEDTYEVVSGIASGLATAINEFANDDAFAKIGEGIAKIMKAGISAWTGFVSGDGEGQNGINFKNLGIKIGEGINTFFDTMNEPIKKGAHKGLTGWQSLGRDISDSIYGITDALVEAIITTEFTDVGQAIADMIGAIKFEDITWKLGKLVQTLASKVYELVKDKDSWKKLGTRIGEGLRNFFDGVSTKGWKDIGGIISSSINGIATALIAAMDNDELWERVGKAIGSFLSGIEWLETWFKFRKVAKTVLKALANAIKGWAKSNPISLVITASLIAANLTMTGIKKAVKTVMIQALANYSVTGLAVKVAGISLIISGISDTIEGIKENDIKKKIKAAVKLALGGSLAFSIPVSIALPLTIAAGSVTWAFDTWSKILKAASESSTEEGKSILRQALENMWKDIINGDYKWTINIGLETVWQQKFSINEIKALINDLIYYATKDLPDVVKSFFGFDKLELSKYKTQIDADDTGGGGKISDNTNNASNKKETNIINTDKLKELDKLINGNDEFVPLNVKLNADTETDIKEIKTNAQTYWNSNKTGTKNLKSEIKDNTNFKNLYTNDVKPKWETASKNGLSVEVTNSTKVKDLWSGNNGLKTQWGTKNLSVGITDFSSSKVNKLFSNSDKTGLKQLWGDKNLLVGLSGFTTKQVSDLYGNSKSGLVKTWGTKNLSVGFSTTTNKVKEVFTTVQKYFDSNAFDIALSIDTSKKSSNSSLIGKGNSGGIFKADGGVYSQGTWKSIDQYASGGIPSHGTHFIAGENGAEAVGHINGRTEVLNQSQMASVMYNAVYNAVDAVMSRYNGQNSGDTVVQIDGKEVARATQKVANDYMRRTGNPYFAY